MRRTAEQNRKFHMLLSLCSYSDDKKKELVLRCTAGRTNHSSDMDEMEMQFAINELKYFRQQTFKRYMPVIALCCRKLGWIYVDNEIDYHSLNAYIGKYYNKPGLSRLTAEEMSKLVVSLKQIAKRKGIVI